MKSRKFKPDQLVRLKVGLTVRKRKGQMFRYIGKVSGRGCHVEDQYGNRHIIASEKLEVVPDGIDVDTIPNYLFKYYLGLKEESIPVSTEFLRKIAGMSPDKAMKALQGEYPQHFPAPVFNFGRETTITVSITESNPLFIADGLAPEGKEFKLLCINHHDFEYKIVKHSGYDMLEFIRK